MLIFKAIVTLCLIFGYVYFVWKEAGVATAYAMFFQTLMIFALSYQIQKLKEKG